MTSQASPAVLDAYVSMQEAMAVLADATDAYSVSYTDSFEKAVVQLCSAATTCYIETARKEHAQSVRIFVVDSIRCAASLLARVVMYCDDKRLHGAVSTQLAVHLSSLLSLESATLPPSAPPASLTLQPFPFRAAETVVPVLSAVGHPASGAPVKSTSGSEPVTTVASTHPASLAVNRDGSRTALARRVIDMPTFLRMFFLRIMVQEWQDARLHPLLEQVMHHLRLTQSQLEALLVRPPIGVPPSELHESVKQAQDWVSKASATESAAAVVPAAVYQEYGKAILRGAHDSLHSFTFSVPTTYMLYALGFLQNSTALQQLNVHFPLVVEGRVDHAAGPVVFASALLRHNMRLAIDTTVALRALSITCGEKSALNGGFLSEAKFQALQTLRLQRVRFAVDGVYDLPPTIQQVALEQCYDVRLSMWNGIWYAREIIVDDALLNADDRREFIDLSEEALETHFSRLQEEGIARWQRGEVPREDVKGGNDDSDDGDVTGTTSVSVTAQSRTTSVAAAGKTVVSTESVPAGSAEFSVVSYTTGRTATATIASSARSSSSTSTSSTSATSTTTVAKSSPALDRSRRLEAHELSDENRCVRVFRYWANPLGPYLPLQQQQQEGLRMFCATVGMHLQELVLGFGVTPAVQAVIFKLPFLRVLDLSMSDVKDQKYHCAARATSSDADFRVPACAGTLEEVRAPITFFLPPLETLGTVTSLRSFAEDVRQRVAVSGWRAFTRLRDVHIYQETDARVFTLLELVELMHVWFRNDAALQEESKRVELKRQYASLTVHQEYDMAEFQKRHEGRDGLYVTVDIVMERTRGGRPVMWTVEKPVPEKHWELADSSGGIGVSEPVMGATTVTSWTRWELTGGKRDGGV